MMCPWPQVLRKPHRTPLHACPHLRRITQRSRTNSFAVPRKHRRQRLRRPRPVRLRPIEGPHPSSKHTSVRKAFTEMHLRQKRQEDGPSFCEPSDDWARSCDEPQRRTLTAIPVHKHRFFWTDESPIANNTHWRDDCWTRSRVGVLCCSPEDQSEPNCS